LFLGYLARSAEDKRIQAMGWEELTGPHGIIYRYGGLPVPEGHR
jgi:hypothetical protein